LLNKSSPPQHAKYAEIISKLEIPDQNLNTPVAIPDEVQRELVEEFKDQ
jgi:hypothetical protein